MVFEGYQHADSSVSFFIVDIPANSGHTGPKLHRHPYEEVFVVLDGRAMFMVGDEKLEVTGGKVVVVPPGVPHKFVSEGPLRSVNIHPARRMSGETLER